MIKQEVIDALKPILDNENYLNHTDLEAGVRVSPRRWEQILLYISASLPPKNKDDANALLENIKINFRNYVSGNYAKLLETVLKRISALLEKKYHIHVSKNEGVSENKWVINLEHQLAQKMKLGEVRSYVPIISGPPGIAKTSMMKQIADDLGLIYAPIDCSTLNKEDVIGIPIPGDDNKTVRFSKPKLLILIEREIKLDSGHAQSQKPKGPYKNLIFFDELNRVSSVEVFNGLRKILLEKDFGNGYHIPPGSIITAAINPNDLGTLELTDHLKDVTDIIPAGPSLEQLKKYIDNTIIPSITVKVPDTKLIIVTMFDLFTKKFRGKASNKRDHNFYLDVGTELYISPREYSAIIATAMIDLDRLLVKLKNYADNKNLILENISESFEGILRTVMLKHGALDENFLNSMETWFKESPETNEALESLTIVKSEKLENLNTILPEYIEDPSRHLYRNPEFVNYLNSVNANKLSSDFGDFLLIYFSDLEARKRQILQTNNPAKRINLEREEIEYLDHKVSGLEYILREIIMAMKFYKKIPGGADALAKVTGSAMGEVMEVGAVDTDEVYTELASLEEKMEKFVNSL